MFRRDAVSSPIKYLTMDSTTDNQIVIELIQELHSEIANLRREAKESNIYAKDVLNMNEASAYTNISKSTIYKMCCRNEIPHYKMGKLTYFKRQELADWLCANRVPTMAEIEQKALKHCIATKM